MTALLSVANGQAIDHGLALVECTVPTQVTYDDWLSDVSLGYAMALYIERWRGTENGRLFLDRRELASALAEGDTADVHVADVPVEFVPCRLRPLPTGVAAAALGALGLAGHTPTGLEAEALGSALESWWERHGGERAYEADFGARVRMTPVVRERVAREAQSVIYDRRATEGRYDGGCYVDDTIP